MTVLAADKIIYLGGEGLVECDAGRRLTVELPHMRLPTFGSYFLDVCPVKSLKRISSMTIPDCSG
jgi:hypothetical protein